MTKANSGEIRFAAVIVESRARPCASFPPSILSVRSLGRRRVDVRRRFPCAENVGAVFDLPPKPNLRGPSSERQTVSLRRTRCCFDGGALAIALIRRRIRRFQWPSGKNKTKLRNETRKRRAFGFDRHESCVRPFGRCFFAASHFKRIGARFLGLGRTFYGFVSVCEWNGLSAGVFPVKYRSVEVKKNRFTYFCFDSGGHRMFIKRFFGSNLERGGRRLEHGRVRRASPYSRSLFGPVSSRTASVFFNFFLKFFFGWPFSPHQPSIDFTDSCAEKKPELGPYFFVISL